jgi:hypothetical protein
MGQQQLLLIILVTIIIGVATVIAINTMGETTLSANLDSVRQDMGRIAVMAQGFYQKPEMMGGGGKSFNPNGNPVDFRLLNFPGTITADPMVAYNHHATYILSGHTNTEFIITSYPSAYPGYVEGEANPDVAYSMVARVEPDEIDIALPGGSLP